MFKTSKFWLVVGVVALVIAGGYFYFSKEGLEIGRKELPRPDYEVSEYSVGGEVLAIDDDVITLKVGRVFVGEDGNYVDYENKKVTIGEKTVIGKIINVDGKISLKPGTRDDIVVGGKITVYSDEDIARKDSFTPLRLDVIL